MIVARAVMDVIIVLYAGFIGAAMFNEVKENGLPDFNRRELVTWCTFSSTISLTLWLIWH